MSIYAIGDVQGCFDELQLLLKHIQYNSAHDELWFVGDLVNRGPQSLQVLRFVKQLPRAVVVLGNHDIHLLALANGVPYSKHTLYDVLNAPDRDELLNWLLHCPILHQDYGYTMVHAGIYPAWDMAQAKQLANELETALQNSNLKELVPALYGNHPDRWNDGLKGFERLRFITNVFTRMRFCTEAGQLEFDSTGEMGSQPPGFLPWFKIPNRKTANEKIIFGHWAALLGKSDEKNAFALDAGCIWGNNLMAMRLEDQKLFSVSCIRSNKIKL